MTGYTIRRDGEADWKLVRAIRLRALTESPDAFSSTLAAELDLSDRDWRIRCDNESAVNYLANDSNNEIVGIAVGAPYVELHRTAGLFGMWIAPTARQHGIGAALVNAVVAWVRTENFHRIVLDVGSSNEAALRLYESCGFIDAGNVPAAPKLNQNVCERQLELSLR